MMNLRQLIFALGLMVASTASGLLTQATPKMRIVEIANNTSYEFSCTDRLAQVANPVILKPGVTTQVDIAVDLGNYLQAWHLLCMSSDGKLILHGSEARGKEQHAQFYLQEVGKSFWQSRIEMYLNFEVGFFANIKEQTVGYKDELITDWSAVLKSPLWPSVSSDVVTTSDISSADLCSGEGLSYRMVISNSQIELIKK